MWVVNRSSTAPPPFSRSSTRRGYTPSWVRSRRPGSRARAGSWNDRVAVKFPLGSTLSSLSGVDVTSSREPTGRSCRVWPNAERERRRAWVFSTSSTDARSLTPSTCSPRRNDPPGCTHGLCDVRLSVGRGAAASETPGRATKTRAVARKANKRRAVARWRGPLIELTAEHRQARRLDAEPGPRVQRESGLVPQLGVDDRPCCASPPHPAKGVGHERLTHAAVLLRGAHGEALEVPLPGRSSGDGIPDHGPASGGDDTEAGQRHRLERLLEAGPVEPPERREGSLVDREHGLLVTAAGASGCAAAVRRQLEQVVGEQVQTLVGIEAGEEERTLFGGSQGGGDDARVALARQAVGATLDEVPRG